MRILTVGNMYPPHHLGGYELVWQAAVQALRDTGHEVRVLTTGHREPTGEGVGEDADVHRQLRWYWQAHEFPRLSLRARLELERHNHAVMGFHLGALRPDLVSWWAMGGMSLTLVERVRCAGLPALAWVNDDWLSYGPIVDQWLSAARRAGPLARVLEPLAEVPTRVDLDRAARYVFCSESVRRGALTDHPGLADTAVHYQGVARDFEPAPERQWSGRLVYAGRIDERKGLGTLIEAVAGLPDMTLRVIGGGDERAVQRLCAAAAAADGRVAFDDPMPRGELACAYADADAAAFPVEWGEPWGLVPLEAMAVGRPVVATGRGGSGEYLEHERNALLFEAGDVEALRAALRRLAGEAALRARLREGGFETAARFTEAAWTAAVVREHEERPQATPCGGQRPSASSARGASPRERGARASVRRRR